MSEMSDMHKLIMAMELAKTARVGMELTYFDVIELLGELDSLKSYIAGLEEKQRWRVVANGELPEEEDEYWVWFDDKFTGIKISGYCDYSKQNGWDNTERVTHWMPIPTPPEVQDEH